MYSIWSMNNKWYIQIRKVYKCKSILSVHSRKISIVKKYTENYSTIVTLILIHILVIILVINWWYTHQVDFVLAYHWSQIEHDLNMKFTKGIDTNQLNGKTHVLKMVRNVYRQKYTGCICNRYLTNKSLTLGL